MLAPTRTHISPLGESPASNASVSTSYLTLSEPSTEISDTWIINNFLANRWGCHYIATLMSMIPESHVRLREKCIAVIYGNVMRLYKIIEELAHQRGLTLPSTPPLSADPREEVVIDTQTLTGAIIPYVAEATKEVIESNNRMIRPKEDGGSHWYILAAKLLETGKQYTKSSSAMGAAPVTGEQRALAQLLQLLDMTRLQECYQVMDEELAEVKAKGEGVEWRKEEVASAMSENARLLESFCAVGMQGSS